MLSLVSKNPSPQSTLDNLSDKYQLWERYTAKGYQSHGAKKSALAVDYFSKSLALSQELEECLFDGSCKHSGISMLYSSSHNLAASLNQQRQALKAKTVLGELHEKLIHILKNPFKARALRLEALAYLDKSLFSICSQLAYLNEVSAIHSMILQTESVATEASNALIKS